MSRIAKHLIEDDNNDILISIASLWEISIKTALGKLHITGKYETVINDLTDNLIEILPINFAHTVEQNRLPFYHRDAFDRIIISQAIVENMSIVSADDAFDQYLQGTSVQRVW